MNAWISLLKSFPEQNAFTTEEIASFDKCSVKKNAQILDKQLNRQL